MFSSYLAGQLGAAIGLGFPGVVAPLFFRRSRLASVLSGIVAALILPIGAIYYDAHPGSPEDHAVLLALAALIGVGAGLLLYAIAGRRKVA